uniref:Antitoxin of toxin-antitoxin system, YdaS/YdaT n=1 Tax=Candidatus Kentrum sp. TC TaxID=2126339 RepID=A0A450Z8S8_9GAMM|nr:MAG: Putative antitoxin of toxin-antitoxin system, YdaS/YdaT [Candidatus Kentron sp. TC]
MNSFKETPPEKAIRILGGKTNLSIQIKLGTSAIHGWVLRGRVPVAHVISVERATHGEVSRHELCPELEMLFGKKPSIPHNYPRFASREISVRKAIELIGGLTKTSLEVRVSVGAVNGWVESGKIPHKHVLAVEKATNGEVTRYDLCPELVEILLAPKPWEDEENEKKVPKILENNGGNNGGNNDGNLDPEELLDPSDYLVPHPWLKALSTGDYV